MALCGETRSGVWHRLDDIMVDTTMTPEVVPGEGVLAGVATIRAAGYVRARSDSSWWPYQPASAGTSETGEPTTLNAVPYYTWGNREHGAMRVWVPTSHII
jgi:DUF1680 family protein